ncbi:MAG: cytidine deaminase [Candidatus Woesearchaeota archaeon]
MKNEVIKDMIKEAKIAMKNAYVPVTHHGVGASVLTKKGNIHKGANVQSVISGLGTCAERAAIDNMVSNGEYSIQAVCVVSNSFIYPCGACLQYIGEFSEISGKNIPIIMANSAGKHKIKYLHELFPHVYGPLESHKNIKKYKK